jgi:glycosyltransferase involved in cell wall biosynthesis
MRVYRDLGARVYVVELEPSLQKLVGEQIYESLRINFSPRWGVDALTQLKNLFILVFAAFCMSRRVRFNLVYAYNQDLENVLPAFVIKLLTGKPMVLIFHLFYRDYAKSFREALSERLLKGFSLNGALLRSFLGFLRNIAFRGADLIICVSDSVRKEVVRHIQTQRVAVVRNGVNASVFRKIECPKAYDAAFLGRLCHQKGVDVLLNAWKMVTLEFDEAKLVLIRGGDQDRVTHYKEMVHKLGLQDNVVMKGFIPDKELVSLLNSSKLFVFPSRYDGFALAVAEAMACGLPCIISDIPALREIYGEAAILVKPDDAECLANTIKEVLSNRSEMELLSRKSRMLAGSLDWRMTVNAEINLIKAILRKSVRMQ